MAVGWHMSAAGVIEGCVQGEAGGEGGRAIDLGDRVEDVVEIS